MPRPTRRERELKMQINELNARIAELSKALELAQANQAAAMRNRTRSEKIVPDGLSAEALEYLGLNRLLTTPNASWTEFHEGEIYFNTGIMGLIEIGRYAIMEEEAENDPNWPRDPITKKPIWPEGEKVMPWFEGRFAALVEQRNSLDRKSKSELIQWFTSLPPLYPQSMGTVEQRTPQYIPPQPTSPPQQGFFSKLKNTLFWWRRPQRRY